MGDFASSARARRARRTGPSRHSKGGGWRRVCRASSNSPPLRSIGSDGIASLRRQLEVNEPATAAVRAVRRFGRVQSGVRLGGLVVGCGRGRRRREQCEQSPARRQAFLAAAIGQEAVVADLDEALRQDVHEEATQELFARERHRLGTRVVAVVLVTESLNSMPPRIGSTTGAIAVTGRRSWRRS